MDPYGLFAKAAPAPVANLERLTELAEQQRLQPDAQGARQTRLAADSTVSANDRMQYLWRPVTTLVIVPLFALANAGCR